MEPGRWKKVWPPDMPVRMPRSTMSMPSVTMKPLSPKLMMNRALTAPMASPTASVTGTAQPPGSRPRPWPVPVGTVSQAATPGASPMVDSSDRSIFLTIRTIVSARTRTAISDIVWRTLMMLSVCRNTELTSCPTIAITMMGGIRARSRRRAKAIRRSADTAGFEGSVESFGVPVATVSGIEVHSFHGGHQFVVVPSAGHFGDDAALDHDQDPVADAQVVQLVGGEQDGGAARRPSPPPCAAGTPWTGRRRPRWG